MADTENFEEDLFADLYDDDTTAAKPEPAAAPASAPAAVAPAPSAPDTASAPHFEAHGNDQGSSGDYDPNQAYEEDDDDDDVDFNLGGAPAIAPPPSNGDAHHHDEPAHYNKGSVKNPSAKEDGMHTADGAPV